MTEQSEIKTGVTGVTGVIGYIETKNETSSVPKFTYALLQETNGEECESWYYFLRYQGNEEALKHLQDQLEQVRWYIMDDLSVFELELDYLVSEQTAKEMTKVDINHYSFHRKFDGVLKKIDLGFKPHHSDKKKMSKAFDVLGYGQIEEYIDKEDIDPEDLVNNNSSEESSTSETESDSEESSDTEESSESSSHSEKKKGNLPAALRQPIPRIAAIKQRNNKK